MVVKTLLAAGSQPARSPRQPPRAPPLLREASSPQAPLSVKRGAAASPSRGRRDAASPRTPRDTGLGRAAQPGAALPSSAPRRVRGAGAVSGGPERGSRCAPGG